MELNTTIRWWFTEENIIPIRYYHYPSSVQHRILDIDTKELEKTNNSTTRTLKHIYELLKKHNLFDNKIVVECKIKNNENGSNIFIGWKDWIISIGFGVKPYDGQEAKEINLD